MVDVWTGELKATGEKATVEQYAITLRVEWDDPELGRLSREEEVLWPDCLAVMGEEWLKEHVTESGLAILRQKAAVDGVEVAAKVLAPSAATAMLAERVTMKPAPIVVAKEIGR